MFNSGIEFTSSSDDPDAAKKKGIDQFKRQAI